MVLEEKFNARMRNSFMSVDETAPRMAHLNHIIPVQHQICISLMLPQIASIRHHKLEVGLQKLVSVIGHWLGSRSAVPASSTAFIMSSAPAMLGIGVVLKIEQMVCA